MTQLNPQIILSGQQADIPGAFQRGLEFKQQRAGAAQALEAGALKNQQGITAANRERELFQAKRGLAMIQKATTPELWDYIATRAAPDLVGQFERREELTATFQTLIEALDPSTPDKPTFFKGMRGAVNQIVPDGQGGFTFKEIVPPQEGESAKTSAWAEKVAGWMSVGRSREEAMRLASTKGVVEGESFDFSGEQDASSPQVVTPTPPQGTDGDVDVSRGLGLGGAVRGAIGKFLDFVGFGVYFEDTAKATSDLTFLKTEFLFATRNMINQRMSNQMLDLVDKLTVSPGAIGKEGAMLRLRNGLRLIESNVAGLQRASDNEGGRFSKTDISEATADGILLTNLVKQYKIIIKSLEGMEAAPEERFDLQNELPWDDDFEQRLRKYD